jgi:hypothetical protein
MAGMQQLCFFELHGWRTPDRHASIDHRVGMDSGNGATALAQELAPALVKYWLMVRLYAVSCF